MKTAALLLSATLMTVGGAWVQAQSTTNLNQTGNHVNNQREPGQQSDESDKLDNKGKPMPGSKMRQHERPAKVQRTMKRDKQQRPAPMPADTPNTQPVPGTLSPPAIPGAPVAPMPTVPPTTPATMQ
ncbi:hypothetical protein [Janthinobacterium psychrotolerans]|uniref:Uncharacterized protein n=1 Tax=Janthinobacterium psychrotolerans TaxID=1747903 RepID=A0A1A7C5X7_9BURK|nr:hypothetical protein [Janthinobacterium psychrotolerans]OBV40165.1 hypothetical protein ASR47_101480 [Janthinobacterium psychrotolerans]